MASSAASDQRGTTSAGLAGTVGSSSDVRGIPGGAFGKGTVLAVPASVVGKFWQSQGFDISGHGAPNDFAVKRDALPDEVELVPIASDGTFRVETTGEGLLCLADVFGAGAAPGEPRYVQGGCVVRPADAAEVFLQAEGVTTLQVVRWAKPRSST